MLVVGNYFAGGSGIYCSWLENSSGMCWGLNVLGESVGQNSSTGNDTTFGDGPENLVPGANSKGLAETFMIPCLFVVG